MIVLVGSCNKCGMCCQDSKGNKCAFLVVNKDIGVGNPNATHCGVYKDRYNKMPIRVVDTSGKLVYNSICWKECTEEKIAIINSGVGKGCSLTVLQIEDWRFNKK